MEIHAHNPTTPMTMSVAEVIGVVDRIGRIFQKARDHCLIEKRHRGMVCCCLDRHTGDRVHHDIVGEMAERNLSQYFHRSEEIGRWLFENQQLYVTSSQGGYYPGAVRTDRYIISAAGDPNGKICEAIVIATLKDVNMAYVDWIGAIHAAPNTSMNPILELRAFARRS